MTCLACGRPAPGPLPADSLAVIVGPKKRATIGGEREVLCLVCQMWAGTEAGIIQRSTAADLVETLSSWR